MFVCMFVSLDCQIILVLYDCLPVRLSLHSHQASDSKLTVALWFVAL